MDIDMLINELDVIVENMQFKEEIATCITTVDELIKSLD